MTDAQLSTQNSALSTQHSSRQQLAADLSLLTITLVWGSTFILIKDALGRTAPLLFLGVRFGLAALAMALISLGQQRLHRLNGYEVRVSALAGLVLGAGFALQAIGLRYTTAANAGFITGLSVTLVPVFSLFVLQLRPARAALLGVALAAVGLGLLSIQDNFTVNTGDWLEIASAVTFALHIVLITRFAKQVDAVRFAMMQLVIASGTGLLISAAFELPTEGWSLPPDVLLVAAFMGVVATGLAIVVQTTAQRYTDPTHAAIIYTMEPVSSAIFAAVFAGEALSGRQLLGCALILAGMLVAELAPYFRRLVGESAFHR